MSFITYVPIVDLSSDSEHVDLTVPLPSGCFYIRDSKTGLPCVWNQWENCGWIPDDSEIISSPTRPIRSRAHRLASPVMCEPAVEVPVPVVEEEGCSGRAASVGCVGDVLARPVGKRIVVSERSVHETGSTSAVGGGMVLDDSMRRLFAAYESRIAVLESLVQVLKGKVECLDDVSDAHYGHFLMLDEERLLEEDAMNKRHFRINDLEVVGVTTGQRLKALEDGAGVTEVGLLAVQQ
ncbi:hypothetical protein L1987_15206 [Smallanthus sonchifolius]|uniref:Uncharacterized protein n=1 Tax=Smallanthus sonchifolius TaxID=185202 RepID=A0ACB9J5F3_9ASTR|nr:hypothetical protein L1987_15206 [Smallanthus sonchifolius]